jgi:hypothetical protein
VKFPPQFFELSLRFAERAAEVTGVDFATSLLQYTHLYMRLRLGRSFDPANPLWQAYIAGLEQAEDPVMWTYQFYLQQREETPPPTEFPFGCFSYAVWTDNRVRIHFTNADTPPHRPLSKERMAVRLAELRQMFMEIQAKVPQATNVVGGSWLYNLEAYRRLFPPEFVASAYRGEGELPYLALWGQFLTWDGAIKAELAQAFVDCLPKKKTFAELEACFPFPVLRVECAVGAFYDFYQI